MAERHTPGWSFDNQWRESRRNGQKKAARGDTDWAEDKYLERESRRLGSGPAHHGESKSCADKAVILLAFLGGVAWAASEVVSRAL